MKRAVLTVRTCLGGLICGCFIGAFCFGLLGALYGGVLGNVSLGLDGALLGGGGGGLAGMLAGAFLSVREGGTGTEAIRAAPALPGQQEQDGAWPNSSQARGRPDTLPARKRMLPT